MRMVCFKELNLVRLHGALLLASFVGASAASYQPEVPPMTSGGAPAIQSATPNLATVPRFEKFELNIALTAAYDNPFDPEQVDLQADFTTPSGKHVSVPGFFCQPYRNRNENDDQKRPILETVGKPCWLVRFAPTEPGNYQYSLRLKNHFGNVNQEVKWGPGKFTCAASANHGFIRIAANNPHYFQYDDGTPFFAVGQNLQNDWINYFHFRKLAEAGCNAVRAWMFCHYTWLEWSFKGDISYAKEGDYMRSYAGAGKYNQRLAWIAERYLEQCAKDGLHVMVTFGNGTGGGELSREDKGKHSSWDGHPYSVANGGWLDEPAKFWTDERARKLYKQRLRYIVARYGYCTSVWAWEFWNELGDGRPDVVAWHREMGDYLRGLDPNRHLVTSSTWQVPEKFDEVWKLPAMDFTQTHIYQSGEVIRRGVQRALRVHPAKPHIVGEGGGPAPHAEAKGKDKDKTGPVADPGHVDFHNCLWAAPMSGSAGTTLPWWWRERVEPENLFYHYTAFARFAKGEPWPSFKSDSAKPIQITLDSKPAGPAYSPVVIVPAGAGWGSKAPRNRFTVQPDGTVPGIEDLRGTLFGSKRAEWRNPPVFAVNCPVATRLTVHVTEVSHGKLEIMLDGKSALVSPPLGREGREDIEQDFAIDLPAGAHEIELRNASVDMVRIGRILIANYRDAAKYPDLNAYAVQSDHESLLWLQHRLNAWAYLSVNFKPAPIAGATAEIPGLADGNYRVEWWDTRKGDVTKTEQTTSKSGKLTLALPPISSDIACKLKRQN